MGTRGLLAAVISLSVLGVALAAVPLPSICRTLNPAHNKAPRVIPPPFKIEVSKQQYDPGETLQIIIKATENSKLRGFIIQARRADWNLNQRVPIGFFARIPKTSLNCETTLGNGLIDDQNAYGLADPVKEITLTWTAPRPSEGHIRFWVTMVGNVDEYWVAEKSEIVYDSNAPPMPQTPSPRADNYGAMSSATIETKECGKSKGCYRDPAGCEEQGCSVLATWVATEDTVQFELSADTDGWVAIGFSDDKKMGDDSVVECVWNKKRSMVEVRQSFNVGGEKHNIIVEKPELGLSNIEGYYNDGRVKCRFERVKVMSGEEKIFDLNMAYHLLVAKGKASDDGKKERHVLEPQKDPWVSPSMVYLSNNIDMSGRARYPLVKAHGCLMIIAWMMSASTGIILARYYKLMWPNDRVCGERVWFAMHRMLQLITLFCTALGFILIFIHASGYSKMPELPASAHPPIGITVMILTILNPLLAACRCNPKSTRRPIFNWFHWFFGTCAMVLATPNMFIGLSLPKSHVPWWATWILVAFMLFHLICELLLEIHGCINSPKQKQRSMEYELVKKNDPAREQGYEPEPVGTRFKTIILTMYVLVMIILGLVMVITIAVS